MYLPKLVREKDKILIIKKYEKSVIAGFVYLYLTENTDIKRLEKSILSRDYGGYRGLDILKYYGLKREHSNLFNGQNYDKIKALIKDKINEDYGYKGISDLFENISFTEVKLVVNETRKEEKESLILDFEDIVNLNFEEKEAYFNVISKIRNKVIQDNFRKSLLSEFNNRCAICAIDKPDLLIASHIIPYSQCHGNLEVAGDYQNGLLLCPLHDALFESGKFITFDSNGKILISNKIKEKDYSSYNIDTNLFLNQDYLKEKRKLYLEEHKKMFCLKNQEEKL